MGQTSKTENPGMIDVFGLNSDSFKKNTEEPVKPLDDVEVIDQDVVEVDDTKTDTTEVVDETVETEVDKQEPEKEVEEEEVEEVTANLGEIMQQLADDEVLSFDESKEYDLSVDGLKELIFETNTKAVDKYKETLGDQGKQILDILEKGGSLEEYFNSQESINFEEVPLTDSQGQPITQNLVSLIEDWYKLQNYDEDEIEERLTDLEKAGLLEKEAQLAKKKLVSWQVQEKSRKEADAIKAEEERIASIQKQQEEFKTKVLNTKSIVGFELDKKQAEKLHDYIIKPVGKKGETQFALDNTEEQQLAYAYLSMIKFDKDKLSTGIRTKQAIKLKKHLDNYQDKSVTAKGVAPKVNKDSKKPVIHWNI